MGWLDDRRSQNEARYDRMARYYTPLIRGGSFGGISTLYEALAERLEVPSDATVVELGCGPATVTPHLLARLGRAGRYVGVDLSKEMIAKAKARAGDFGWTNVDFVQSAVLDYEARAPADAVVFSLALSAMPEPERCAERALSTLAPGGQLLILDSFYTGRRLADLVIRAKSPAVGAIPEEFPLAFLERELSDLQVEPLWGGVYSLLVGRRPAH